ncbi:unannotated protein [freshwater metagenome]|uniref:Unannotated protein n=1 Tax=freshwater metagenome TaxID=449393 RepID=A0A6J6CI56_9ZZZZ
MPVPLVGCKTGFEPLLNLNRISGLGEYLLKEINVRGVMHRVELIGGWVRHDQHATLANHRLALVHVEEVAEPQTHHQNGIHDRVDVVGAHVGKAIQHNVSLAFYRNELLLVDLGSGQFVNRFNLAGMHRGERIRGFPRMQNPAATARWEAV